MAINRSLAAAATMMITCPPSYYYDDRSRGMGKSKFAKPGYQPPAYPKVTVTAAGPVNNNRVDSRDRNAPCDCGCGKKRKKCPNGHKVVPDDLRPAHTLSIEDYRAKVYEVIKETTGLTTEMLQYEASHIDKYWADAVITPERCAELVLLMFKYDNEKFVAACDALDAELSAASACDT